MLNHVVYDVFIKGGADEDGDGLHNSSRFGDDLETFTKEGLKFRWKRFWGCTERKHVEQRRKEARTDAVRPCHGGQRMTRS